MISEKQLQANRQNAQKSTGPKSAHGKATVSSNALRHGFRSQRIVIDGECADEYNDFRNELIARFAPADILETMLVDRAVAGFWRLRRAGRMETEMLEMMQSSDQHDQGATDLRDTVGQLKRLLKKQIAASDRAAARPAPAPVRRLPFKGFDGAMAAWHATEDGRLCAAGKWPDDPSHPSPHDSFSAFLKAEREKAKPQTSCTDAAAPSPPEPVIVDETVFTEQTHFDLPTDDLPPADTQPSRSLGNVVAADLRGSNTILKLKRYEAHIERSLFRNLAKLEHFQEKRLAREVKVNGPMDIESEPIQAPTEDCCN